VTFYHLFNR